mmetsp:Transcript_19583/g.47837  ORF Transcript_19583/g.47837 Transcript_19583/m.47837 type:complete len:304 (+) Transcript_19583:862-1773(+)
MMLARLRLPLAFLIPGAIGESPSSLFARIELTIWSWICCRSLPFRLLPCLRSCSFFSLAGWGRSRRFFPGDCAVANGEGAPSTWKRAGFTASCALRTWSSMESRASCVASALLNLAAISSSVSGCWDIPRSLVTVRLNAEGSLLFASLASFASSRSTLRSGSSLKAMISRNGREMSALPRVCAFRAAHSFGRKAWPLRGSTGTTSLRISVTRCSSSSSPEFVRPRRRAAPCCPTPPPSSLCLKARRDMTLFGVTRSWSRVASLALSKAFRSRLLICCSSSSPSFTLRSIGELSRRYFPPRRSR